MGKEAEEIRLQKQLGDGSWPDPGPSRTVRGWSRRVLMGARAGLRDNISKCRQESPQNLVPSPHPSPSSQLAYT